MANLSGSRLWEWKGRFTYFNWANKRILASPPGGDCLNLLFPLITLESTIKRNLKNLVNRFWWNTFHKTGQCLWVTKKCIWAKNKTTFFWGLTTYRKHVSWLTAIQQHDNESIDNADCCILFKDPRHMALGRLQVSLWSDTHFKQVK